MKCKDCGCTDDMACLGGCYWAHAWHCSECCTCATAETRLTELVAEGWLTEKQADDLRKFWEK